MWGLGFRVWGLGFRVSGFGFRVSGFGFRVWGVGCRVSGDSRAGGTGWGRNWLGSDSVYLFRALRAVLVPRRQNERLFVPAGGRAGTGLGLFG